MTKQLSVSIPLCVFLALGATAGASAAAASRGVDPSIMDRSVDPCSDFYQFSCGGWLKNNPIPSDKSRWGRFNEVAERNRAVLRGILENAARTEAKREADEQRIGDFYASCMDEAAINGAGAAPLKPELDRIAALDGREGLASELAHLQSIGVSALFSFGAVQDYQDASKMIAGTDQGGLALPDRDYYLKPEFSEDLKAYAGHVERMFALLGGAPVKAAQDARTVLGIETRLAQASMDRTERRDPLKVHHKMALSEFEALTPAFDWSRYSSAGGAPAFASLDVAAPGFFKGLQSALSSVPLSDWKTYLRWQLVHAQAPVLSSSFVDEDFAFFDKKLTGQKELESRWKRCVKMTDAAVGEALGRAYVESAFGRQGKASTLDAVGRIESAMGEDLKLLPWMGEETRRQAMVKLRAIANKIGYPDKWRDYSRLKIVRGDAAGNARRAAAFEFERQLAKIGKPVDRQEWGMTPPTVNAYYDPQMNDINFPAGILQPPFFSVEADTASNLGGIGAVIAHELTHGFDDEGRHYDALGNLRDWWTAEDSKAFEAKAQGITEEYSRFVAVKDPADPAREIKVNGKLTLGENIADNGGLRLAYMALERALNGSEGLIDGLAPEQRFFVNFAQIWCTNQTDEASKMRATTDPHSPPKYRVMGALSNMPEFQRAFSCRDGSPMTSPNPSRVW